MVAIWTALGLTQMRPSPGVSVVRGRVDVHYDGLRSHSTCVIVVPDTRPPFEPFQAYPAWGPRRGSVTGRR